MIAELNRVSKRYGTVTALNRVSLTIGRSEVVALLGANGAGKTTAVKLLLGLLRPSEGTALVFGRNPRLAEARCRVGAMLQTGGVPPTLRVREHIELFSSYYPSPRSIEETVKVAGLAGLENRKYGELSGGQKQRLLFALAICGRPDLLFLDEPTAGLDPEARRAIWKQIRGVVSAGASVLLTTHYLEEAEALAHRVAILASGRIIAEGTPTEVKLQASRGSLEDAFLALTGGQEAFQ